MNTYSIKPQIRKDAVRKDGTTQVVLRVGINSNQDRIPTGIFIKPGDWNSERGEVRRSHPGYNALNIEIRNGISIANNIFEEYRRSRIVLTTRIFRQAYLHPSSRENFLEYMRIAIAKRFELGEIVKTTVYKHTAVLNRLMAFKPQILFSEIDQTLIEEFDLWYLKYLKQTKGNFLVNNGRNARANAQKAMKIYLKRAQKDHIKFQMPDLNTKQVFEEAQFLTEEEVRVLMAMYVKEDYYPENWKGVLQVFLWMCFTGQSYTDAMDCNWEENIIGNNLRYIRNKQKRFRKVVTVPITPIAGQYLPAQKTKGKVFPQMKNQPFNRILKGIAKAAGIKIKLTAKVARDTFATLFVEAVGGDVFTLMEIMGHTKIETTRKYVHLSQGHKEKQVLRAFERFWLES